MITARTRATMRLLAIFETLFAASAVYGGIALIAGAPGFMMPVEWLAPLGLTNGAHLGRVGPEAAGSSAQHSRSCPWSGC